jgi:formylglycine-generating enzyme required for sulfatase activity
VLVGDPGSGKTTLLRHLAAILAREPSPRWIPLFESLPRLIRKREWLLDRVARRLERAGHPARGLPAVLDQMGREGRLLLLLDGLDEVPRDYREEAESLLRHLAARWPETPFVVATRGIGYRRPGSEFREMEILPLDSARRREFLARWFGRHDGSANWQRADEGFAVLTGNRNLEELSGNPLYLTLMALLLEHGTSPARDRTRLYDQILHLLLDGKHRLEPLPIPARKSVHQALSYLAYSMTRDHHEAEPVEEIEARLYQPEANPLIEPLERVPRWRRSLRPFLDDVAERTGILGPHDGPDADWRFWHRTFREALAAERLEELWREGGETGLLDLAKSIEGDLRWWAEPYALLAGRVEDPDSLVKALVGTNRELGLRSLATAQGLRDETLAEILELSNDWRQRTRVYERLPELIGDPERALLLLDRLRPRTRDGNDLYFLDLSAAGVARLWPEAARQSAALRQRLYDHIPSPPEDLFRRLETPAGGRVRLWQEIPQGSFLMGSPEGEGDEDEHPLHTVKLVAPFLMASAPVTRAQYAAFDPDHRFPAREDIRSEELAHHPVVNVTWYAAVAFCRWLAASFSWARGARLASEAEWEYACRAGTTTCYWSGNDERTLARVGWFRANSGGRTHKVGEKAANPWGLYDLHGNVREWTASPWSVDYSGFRNGRTIDPTAKRAEDREEPPGVGRVLRGGGYDDKAVDTRAASRREQGPAFESPAVGFRVVISS